MGDNRIPWGWARGPFGNFFSRTDNLLGQADTTPDVTLGNLFWTNNSGATTITDFDLSGHGPNVSQQFEGKVITVFMLDANTTIQGNGARIFLAGTDAALTGSNVNVSFVYHNSAWYETSRSVNQTSFLHVQSSNLASNGMVNASNKNLVNVIVSAGSAVTLRGATGGEQGQRLSLYAQGSNFTLVVNSAAANTFALTSSSSTTSFVVGGSALLSFYYVGSRWIEAREGTNTGSI